MDQAVYRDGTWFILLSSDGDVREATWGWSATGDTGQVVKIAETSSEKVSARDKFLWHKTTAELRLGKRSS